MFHQGCEIQRMKTFQRDKTFSSSTSTSRQSEKYKKQKCSKYEKWSATWKFVRWLRPRSWKVMMAGPWKRETKCIKRFFLVSLFIPLDFQPGRQGRGHRGRSGSPRWQDRMLAEIIQFNLISLKFMICKFTLVTGCRLKLFQRHYLMIKEKWWCEKI